MSRGDEPPTGSRPRRCRVRVIAYAGAAAFLPYIVMKTIWALGGTFGGVAAVSYQRRTRLRCVS